MTSPAYTRITKHDDPAKPHRSVWATPTPGVFVKLHTRQRSGLGRVTFEITPSACDENGTALRRPDGEVSFLSTQASGAQYRKLFQRVTGRVDNEPLAAQIEREQKFVVAMVEQAVNLEREADAAPR